MSKRKTKPTSKVTRAQEAASDIYLDPEQIDVEATKQANTFFKWSRRLARAKTVSEKLEHMVDVQEARYQIDCRAHPADFGLENVTEPAIKAAVKIHKPFVRLVEQWYEARAAFTLLEPIVKAMEQKKRMLEILTTLHGQEYFAGPSVPRNLPSAWKEYRDGLDEDATFKLKSKARKRVTRG